MTRPTFIDLYSGIGIGSLGFVKAGLELVGAVDVDPKASAIYEKNLGVSPMVGDLAKISGAQILKRAGLRRGELFSCVACPPCQAFSSLRKTRLKKRQRDFRKRHLRVFAQRIKELRPKVVVLENVRGLMLGRNVAYLGEFIASLRQLGYHLKSNVLDAASFGIPQHRLRLVLLAVKGKEPSLPESTHSSPKSDDGKPHWLTVRKAIGDLPSLEAGQGDRRDPLHRAAIHSESVLKIIRNIPPDGGGRKDLPPELWLPCHKRLLEKGTRGAESIYGRMRWEEPSPTITTRSHVPSCGRFVHPVQDRGITLREAARLQLIPDSYRIWGSKDQIGRWIGNAFPVAFSEAIAKQALEHA